MWPQIIIPPEAIEFAKTQQMVQGDTLAGTKETIEEDIEDLPVIDEKKTVKDWLINNKNILTIAGLITAGFLATLIFKKIRNAN